MDVSLVGDIEDELVSGCREDRVKRDGQFDDPEVRPEVAAGNREAVDKGLPDLLGELAQLRIGKDFHIIRGMDGMKKRTKRRAAGGGGFRRG